MRFLSVCSGIEAASSAWKPLGWKAVAFSEIESFPCAVLAHHYPDVPNHGDMTKFKDWPDHAIDLLAGGTPCQSFSVAGLRKGLDDPRGNLMLTYGAIAAKYRPKWLVWENVPGVLSSNGGRDFGTFLGMLGQLGYGFAYRVLDAQYFGVAQRRRRVFVVGCLGDWRSAAAVLFERHSLSGHPAPSREARKVAPTIPSRSTAGGGLGTDFDCDGGTICVATGQSGAEIGADMAPTLNCNHEAPYVAHSLRGEGFDASEDGTGRGTPLVPVAFHPTQDPISSTDGTTHCIGTGSSGGTATVAVAFSAKDYGGDAMTDLSPTLRAGGHNTSHANAGVMPAVMQAMQVRRLTPRECERLQGFPDDYTLIPWKAHQAWAKRKGTHADGKSFEEWLIETTGRGLREPTTQDCPDGPRYKALGNSWAVPVAAWIGRRIEAVEAIQKMKEAA